MRQRVLIVPGLTGPFSEGHRAAYDLLRSAAVDRAVIADVVVLPGQRNDAGDHSGTLSFSAAVATVAERLRQARAHDEPLRVVGLSFGCPVVLKAISEVPEATKSIQTAVLWGPSPLWSSWNAFISMSGRDALGVGTMMIGDRQFYLDLWPIEPLLLEAPVPLIVASGSDDVYCTPEYVHYLAERARAHVTALARPQAFGVIRGCPHTVRGNVGENIAAYLSLVFDAIPQPTAVEEAQMAMWRVVDPNR